MKYKGMTVNEALCESGLDKEFYDAIDRKDSKKVRQILESIGLNEKSIKPILEQHELN